MVSGPPEEGTTVSLGRAESDNQAEAGNDHEGDEALPRVALLQGDGVLRGLPAGGSPQRLPGDNRAAHQHHGNPEQQDAVEDRIEIDHEPSEVFRAHCVDTDLVSFLHSLECTRAAVPQFTLAFAAPALAIRPTAMTRDPYTHCSLRPPATGSTRLNIDLEGLGS
jgi:hypothetical protein